jgi:hypothetical protein
MERQRVLVPRRVQRFDVLERAPRVGGPRLARLRSH